MEVSCPWMTIVIKLEINTKLETISRKSQSSNTMYQQCVIQKVMKKRLVYIYPNKKMQAKF